MLVAEVLPLPLQMRLIKGRQASPEEPRDEEMIRFPAVQEIWEVSCGLREDRDERVPRARKADPKAGLYDIAS
jgi:hypothetical protein